MYVYFQIKRKEVELQQKEASLAELEHQIRLQPIQQVHILPNPFPLT